MGSASLVGGTVGAVLLLVLPAEAFTAIVPVLLAVSLVLVITQPTLQKALALGADDALLVTTRARAQDVKRVVESLKAAGRDELV